MKTALEILKANDQQPQSFVYNHNDILKAMEEYASQQTTELKEEVKASEEVIYELQRSTKRMQDDWDKLQKELSDFKALVKQMREKSKDHSNTLGKKRFTKLCELRDLETKVDKYLQE